MKVDRTSKRKSSARAASAGGRAAPVGQAREAFSSKFMVANRDAIRGELDKLIIQIDEQAREVERSLTFAALDRYRELVRQFIGIAVNELYVVEEKISVDSVGRQKSLITVKKINTILEDLANNFLERQKNLLQFVATLDQIRGLLLDLYT